MSDAIKGIVLLEGPNATGKSTLANELQAKCPNSIQVHCTYRFKKLMWTYHLAALRKALRFADTGLAIIDRNWVSEEVYASVYRNGTAWPHQGRILQKLLLKHGVLTVMCIMPENHVIKQIAEHRAVNYHSPEFLEKPGAVARRYWNSYYGAEPSTRTTYVDDVMATGGFCGRKDAMCYQLNADGSNLDGVIGKILNRLYSLRVNQYQPALQYAARNVAGSLYAAKWLIVGDAVNHPDFTRCWPFMAYKDSTLFMAKAMHAINCREEEFMWTNACCTESHIKPILAASSSLKVVALGNKASTVLKKDGINHVSIHHPAYGSRFMTLDAWTAELRSALAV